jgi:hypothetical protein
MRVVVFAATVCAAVIFAGAAHAEPGLIVGMADDGLKSAPVETSAVARDLGIRAFTLSVPWQPGESQLSAATAGALTTAVVNAGGARIVFAVYGGDQTPANPDWREHFCSYARDALARFPMVNDIVIGNEPNLSFFWQPQFGPDGSSLAPMQYLALLERCYDLLHALRPNVNVIAPATSPGGNDNPFGESNISHSPTSFILKLGAAYRASGRTRPIFDTLGHHPYPASSNERPWRSHSSDRIISVGDLDRLVASVTEAFAGTAQRVPSGGLPIWYLETGYQTTPDASKAGLYFGTENWPGPVPDEAGGEPAEPRPSPDSLAPDQATQFLDSLRLVYCQPYVQAVFNFKLRDEADLERWQSGVLWADGTRKDSYGAFRRAVAEINSRSVNCSTLKSSPATAGTTAASSATGTDTLRGRQDRRIATRLAWAAARPAAFGFARLEARLMVGDQPLAGRQVTFGFDDTLLLTTTGKHGLARVPVARPLPPGAHVVNVTYRGNRTHSPSAIKVLLRVKNSRATISTVREKRQLTSTVDGLYVRSNGRSVAGSVLVRAGGKVVRARRLNALGIAADARVAWFAGVTRNGKRFVGKIETRDRKGGDVLRLWLAGRPLRAVRGLDVRIVRTRG